MRGMSASNLGAAEIPMGLLITAVVISISIPMVVSAFSDLSVNMTVMALERELSDLLRIVRAVMEGGAGSSIEIDLDLEEWGSSRMEEVIIGGPVGVGSERCLVSFRVQGYGRGFLSLDPPVPMTSWEGDEGLELQAGSYRLLVRHWTAGDEDVCTFRII
ncbi:MAG: hypothetical protein ACMUHY_09450 [Thermoplasmatota archaeon]